MRRIHPINIVWAVAVVLLSISIAWAITGVINLRTDFDASQADVQALRAQLLEAGVKPDVGPAGDPGDRGEQGNPGVDGRDGRDGRDGQTPACWFTVSQCVGPQGPAGEPGISGVDGVDGQDGQDGATGPQGEPGIQGPKGDPGDPGNGCPAGYSWQPDTVRGDAVLICTKDPA